MISEFFISILMHIGQWVGDLMPDWALPPELLNIDDQINGLFGFVGGFEPLANWPLIGVLCAVPLTVWAASLTFSAIKSLIPFIGK